MMSAGVVRRRASDSFATPCILDEVTTEHLVSVQRHPRIFEL